MTQLALFPKPAPEPKKQIFYKDLDIHRRINVRANCFIHGLYYKGNNYGAYPLSGEILRKSFQLSKSYFKDYNLNAGASQRYRSERKKTVLFS